MNKCVWELSKDHCLAFCAHWMSIRTLITYKGQCSLLLFLRLAQIIHPFSEGPPRPEGMKSLYALSRRKVGFVASEGRSSRVGVAISLGILSRPPNGMEWNGLDWTVVYMFCLLLG
ncbi:hypothetical protein L6452_43616 [Arctium lappa]|uniref:Uncharacterized protein n=1 Tax=Arctium lappa TaxID=4217 RepID=A0ACB8XDN3_ARCLA|nr:hypothetical protein L6452_43616 [Arctium lappa]